MPRYKVTFKPADVSIEVDSEEFPYGETGEPGSVLDIALTHGVQIEHACGGMGVCGTCHVIAEQGADNLSEATDDELDTLDHVQGGTTNSRLACQAVVKGDVVIVVPGG